MANIDIALLFDEPDISRKKLFEEALLGAKRGRVLYIIYEEFNELPLLSQELNSLNKHYMKMITFLYAKSLDSLIESISTLPEWQSVPTTIILDDLSAYCNKNNVQNACGVIALLIDTARCCSISLKTLCKIFVSISKNSVGEDYCNILNELYYKNS